MAGGVPGVVVGGVDAVAEVGQGVDHPDFEGALVEGGVVGGAEQDGVVDVGGAAVVVEDDVVAVALCGPFSAPCGDAPVAVAGDEGAALGGVMYRVVRPNQSGSPRAPTTRGAMPVSQASCWMTRAGMIPIPSRIP